jgi:hypothetical protein
MNSRGRSFSAASLEEFTVASPKPAARVTAPSINKQVFS